VSHLPAQTPLPADRCPGGESRSIAGEWTRHGEAGESGRAIRVLIVADTRLYREALSEMLRRRDGFAVAGATASSREALSDLQRFAPDVVVIDMATPESLAAVRELHRSAPGVCVVALGVTELEDDVLRCAEAGAAGYVTREASLEDLLAAIKDAARGELQCSPRIAGRLLRRLAALAADRPWTPSVARLTAREWDIVRLIEANLSNKQIADRLGIEVATVKNHVHNLLEKLNVHRRTDVRRLLGPAAAGREASLPAGR
jgi:DNA-binding NarL/FixJ family response regulator